MFLISRNAQFLSITTVTLVYGVRFGADVARGVIGLVQGLSFIAAENKEQKHSIIKKLLKVHLISGAEGNINYKTDT
jgi:hypothetical protein